jgi:DNA-binding MarR family transcriptional regulator
MGRRTSPKSIDVANALHSAAIHLLRRLRREDDRAGISAAKLSLLSVVVFRGPMRLTDLARAEQVRPPTMTRLVASMEKGKLLRRRPDPGDARAVRIEATARGARILHAGRRRRVALLAAAIDTVPVEQRDALHAAASMIEELSRQLEAPAGRGMGACRSERARSTRADDT